jgi:hypothetical protein
MLSFQRSPSSSLMIIVVVLAVNSLSPRHLLSSPFFRVGGTLHPLGGLRKLQYCLLGKNALRGTLEGLAALVEALETLEVNDNEHLYGDMPPGLKERWNKGETLQRHSRPSLKAVIIN